MAARVDPKPLVEPISIAPLKRAESKCLRVRMIACVNHDHTQTHQSRYRRTGRSELSGAPSVRAADGWGRGSLAKAKSGFRY